MRNRHLLFSLTAALTLTTGTARADQVCWYDLECHPVCESTFECGWTYTETGLIMDCVLVQDCYEECEQVEFCEEEEPPPDGGPDFIGYTQCKTTQVTFQTLGSFPPPLGLIVAVCDNYCEVYCDGVKSHTYWTHHICQPGECYTEEGPCEQIYPVEEGDPFCE